MAIQNYLAHEMSHRLRCEAQKLKCYAVRRFFKTGNKISILDIMRRVSRSVPTGNWFRISLRTLRRIFELSRSRTISSR